MRKKDVKRSFRPYRMPLKLEALIEERLNPKDKFDLLRKLVEIACPDLVGLTEDFYNADMVYKTQVPTPTNKAPAVDMAKLAEALAKLLQK